MMVLHKYDNDDDYGLCYTCNKSASMPNCQNLSLRITEKTIAIIIAIGIAIANSQKWWV